MFVQKVDSILYVATKYNSGFDLITTWKKCMANDIFTFEIVALYENSSDTINTNVTRPYSTLILRATSTDNIGPILFDGNFAGGNHTFRDSFDVSHKTAECISVEIINNDSILSVNCEFFTDTLKINVINNIFNPPDLPVKNIYITERVEYKIINRSIETRVQHDILEDIYINRYYGMQVANNSNIQKNIFFINSQHPNEVLMEDGLNSGNISEYPDSYKFIHYNTDKSITQGNFS